MAVKITYYVHGTTTDNERNRATGQLHGKLSEAGKKQSIELASIISTREYDAVFSSDLHRAVQTAMILFADRFEIFQDRRLRECDYGDLNGNPHSFKDDIDQYVDRPFLGGESYRDVEHRMADFLDMLYREYNGKRVALIAHQGPQLALDVLLKGKTWEQAIAEDWRRTKNFQPGWKYELKTK